MTIYFIQLGSSGPIKIGYASRLKARVAQLQTASHEPLTVLAAIPGGFGKERELHSQFANLRLHGEWFRPEPELLAHIGELATEGEEPNAGEAPDPDKWTKEAMAWLVRIEQYASNANGEAIASNRPDIAQRLGVSIGFLEGLRRGRIAAITCADYERLRFAIVAYTESERDRLLSILNETQLESAKEILRAAG
jgi:hypothetical protein